jgi:hypothetical protein
MTTFSLSQVQKLLLFAAWRCRCADGDPLFNEANISAAEAIVTQFLIALPAASGSRDTILELSKNVVLELNRLGGVEGSMGNFIETLEREELCDLINGAARIAGLDEDERVDITEPWREW